MELVCCFCDDVVIPVLNWNCESELAAGVVDEHHAHLCLTRSDAVPRQCDPGVIAETNALQLGWAEYPYHDPAWTASPHFARNPMLWVLSADRSQCPSWMVPMLKVGRHVSKAL